MTTSQRPSSLSRRQTLGGVAAAGLGTPLLAACGEDGERVQDAVDQAGDAAESAGETVGDLIERADVPEGGGTVYADAKVVVTQPTAGDFKAFSAICTHQGCVVQDVTDTINCGCHGSQFSIEDGSVVTGPATRPLDEASISVDENGIQLG